MSNNPQTDYQSYLLRLWRTNPQGAWHSSLHSTASGDKYTFADLSALLQFLIGQLKAAGDPVSDDLIALAAWLQEQKGKSSPPNH